MEQTTRFAEARNQRRTKCGGLCVETEHVRLLMGHSDYNVLRNYLHLAERDLRETMQKFNLLNRFG